MRLKIDFSSLEGAVRRMGTQPRQVVIDWRRPEELDEIEIRLTEGIEVRLEDVAVNPGGLLAYQGHQVVLYIPDQGRNIEEVIRDGTQGKKFHIADCKTLQAMKMAGRYERYHVRNGLSPMFKVYGLTPDGRTIEDAEASLNVCRNCLKQLNYKGYQVEAGRERDALVRRFSLEEFFARYSSYFQKLPRDAAEKLRANVYPAGWEEFSYRIRSQAKWVCSCCSVSLKEHKNLLHLHHINGNRNDNRTENLTVLCADCHSKQALHDFMFVRHSDRLTIQRLRREQKVYKYSGGQSFSLETWDEVLKLADPAVHDLLSLLKLNGVAAPEIGFDIQGPKGEVFYSNAELAWPDKKRAVILVEDDASEKLRTSGWEVLTVTEACRKYAFDW